MKTFSWIMWAWVIILAANPPAACAAAQPPNVPDDTPVDLRSFGLEFRGPVHWLRMPELAYSQLARFASIEKGKVTGLLEVNAVPAQGRGVKDVAASVATALNGQVRDKSTISPEPAGTVEISLQPRDQFPAGHAAVFAERDQFVVVQVGAADAASVAAAFKSVMASMSIKQPTPPVDDLAVDRKRPLALFESAVLIPLPEPFRPDKVKDSSREMFFGVHDWQTGHDEASLQVQLLPNPNHAAVSEIAAKLASNLSAKLKATIRFAKINTDPEAMISTPFTSNGKDVQRIVQMRIDNDRLAVLIFRSTAADPKIRDRYMEAADKAVKAARTSAAYKEGRDSAGGQQPK